MKKVFATIAIGCLIAAVASLAQLPKPGSGGGTSGASGHATTYGAYASLPGTCSTGDRYFTSDSIYELLCTATNTWTAFFQGRKVTIPPSTGWSWVNQETATVDQTFGYIELVAPAAGSNDARMRIRAVTIPYTVTALVHVDCVGTDFCQGGIIVREDANDDQILFGRGHASFPSALAYYFGDPVGAGVAARGTFQTTYSDLIWLRIANNSTNRVFSYSLDGTTYRIYLSHASGTDLAEDKIGLFSNNNHSLQSSVQLISWVVE